MILFDTTHLVDVNHNNVCVISAYFRTLRLAWDEIKAQLEHIATQHFDASKQYTEESIRISQFGNEQKIKRKTVTH